MNICKYPLAISNTGVPATLSKLCRFSSKNLIHAYLKHLNHYYQQFTFQIELFKNAQLKYNMNFLI